MKTKKRRLVIDTNVIIAAARSRRGASFKMMSLIEKGKIKPVLSVPLFYEYEDVLTRLAVGGKKILKQNDVDKILDYLCANSEHHKIYFIWRPILADPGDDQLLELSANAGVKIIVSYNKKHFRGVEQFGITVKTPYEILTELGELS